MGKKFVYLFSEGNANMRELLGGKGANLAEMTNIGLPVPQGFTITTEACTQYYEDGRQLSPEIQDEIMGVTALRQIVNVAALAAVYFTRNLVPFPFIATIIGTALGLTAVSMAFIHAVAK